MANANSPTQTPLLACEALGRQLPKHTPEAGWLVRNVSISLHAGQVLAVMGPSGAGKSTFLRLLNRLDEPTEGQLWLVGKPYHTYLPQALRRRVGMAMQAPNLFPGSVASNIRFGPLQRGEVLNDEVVDAHLKSVGLGAEGFAARPVAQLSGGEASRVSLARTLANNPDVLLLDEPTAALDEAARDSIEALLLNLAAAQGLGLVWITHDHEQAKRVANDVLVLREGQVERYGPGAEILARAEAD